MIAKALPIAVIHLDESCLGNGMEGPNPGGSAGLIETRVTKGIQRREFYIHSPATTNNKMALAGAIAVLQLLSRKGNRLRLLLVSDSEYLVRGVREWLPGWIARGWKRKSGPIENLDLWRALAQSLQSHEVQLTWVRGHAGHPKNEYANNLAMWAAREQRTTPGVMDSEFGVWLAGEQAAGRYVNYDPDTAFDALATRISGGEQFPLALSETGAAARAEG